MPELPDLTVYLEAIERHLVGHRLLQVRLASPFLLRSVEPPLSRLEGATLREVRRVGKRLAFGFAPDAAHAADLFLVLHLMIAGRLRWRPTTVRPPAKAGKVEAASFAFEHGALVLTEASTRKRASLHVVAGAAGLAGHDPGGVELAGLGLAGFTAALQRRNHTLKRALTDPRVFAGIGNAYSDEILHRARLSPMQWTSRLDDLELARLHAATHAVLDDWTRRLREAVGDGFPDKVTAFHEAMAVHGRFGKPCPVCGSRVQRIRYAENEANYCATCQTEGRLLSDRSLARLLKGDWPRTLEELEQKLTTLRAGG